MKDSNERPVPNLCHKRKKKKSAAIKKMLEEVEEMEAKDIIFFTRIDYF